jgi:hypothetical protein
MNASVDPHTGALIRIAHPDDPHGMNWVCSAAESAWFPISNGWGLGYVATPGARVRRWQTPDRRAGNRLVYGLGNLRMTVTRRLRAARLDEEYVLKNVGGTDQPIWETRIFTPFNDNYPDAATCLTRRCHAHVWCGGNVAYVCATRMGGAPPHLGLVVTDGYFAGYSLEGRGWLGCPHARGAIALNARGGTLAPGQSFRMAWTLFWHRGWDDFLAQARAIPGFADVRAARYTLVGKEPPRVTVSDWRAVVGKPDGDLIQVTLPRKRETWLRVQRVPDVAALVRGRAGFIVKHQQVRNPRSPLHGALLAFDNDIDGQLCHPRWNDQNEGRERLGMGILLSLVAQRWPDRAVAAAARRHHAFVRRGLQTRDGTVLNGVNDRRQRLYNYPWVALLHLERKALDECRRTLRQYYRRGGARFYAFPIPIFDTVTAFRAAGRPREAAELLRLFQAHADAVVTTGTRLPPHEVNYEQTIVGPAALIPLETYLCTRDERYLRCAEQFLPLLEAFNGRQPDHHLHDIAIRHWDGYWFGRRQFWGDVFPHYWSALTGWVFYRYWQATGNEAYRRRGREILRNNLGSFRPDGRASCAYIYPDTINGDPARGWDPLANDQDWALVFLLLAARLDPRVISRGAGNELG